MREAVEQFPLGNKQLDRMEKLLVKYTSRERVGNERDPDSARDFVLNNLKLIYDKMAADPKGNNSIKKLLVERACWKMDPPVEIKNLVVDAKDSSRLESYDQKQMAAAAKSKATPPVAPGSAPKPVSLGSSDPNPNDGGEHTL